MTDLLPCLD